ncbi:MAG: hypothetical protein WD055_06165 [Candidatus Dependentiae bacterium]
MKQFCLLVIHLIIFNTIHGITPNPYLAMRSQSENAARELVGLTQHINLAVDHFYSTFAITPAYTQSFYENRIADCLFGNDLASDTLSAIEVTGINATDRDNCKDWLADYFGLPTDFDNTMKFEPIVSNFLVDFYGYFGFNNILCGLFATIHAPIVRTKWDLNLFEVNDQEGIAHYPPGYFSQNARVENVGSGGITSKDIGVKRADLLDSFTDFVFWQKTPNLGDEVTFCPLQNARMTPRNINCNKTKTALGDIQAVLGWNFILNRWYHFGAGLRATAPTGNRPNGKFLFEPIVGNGKHWQLGTQIWGHYTFYVSENEEKQWMAYFLANIMHMFNAKQCRVFDLCDKPNSRWMLAEKLTPDVQHLQASAIQGDIMNLETPDAQFANKFSSVANLTKRSVNVKSNVQVDLVTMLTYIKRNLSIDFGYNLWYRSCEKITKNSCGKTILENELWALKGNAHVYGFTNPGAMPPVEDNTPVALSATQSNATIHNGTNVTTEINGMNVVASRNPIIDNRFWAVATIDNQSVLLNNTISSGAQTNTSNSPIILREDQLDLCNAQTKGLSNKLFFHLAYSWFDFYNQCYVPYIGGGFEFEIGNKNMPQDKQNITCQNCALSQVGVWLKGGFSFN